MGSPVFKHASGEPITPNTVSHLFATRAKQHGVQITLHGLRHTTATVALEAGIHPKVVSERLGHSTVGFTLGVYTHALPTLQLEAAERLDRLLVG